MSKQKLLYYSFFMFFLNNMLCAGLHNYLIHATYGLGINPCSKKQVRCMYVPKDRFLFESIEKELARSKVNIHYDDVWFINNELCKIQREKAYKKRVERLKGLDEYIKKYVSIRSDLQKKLELTYKDNQNDRNKKINEYTLNKINRFSVYALRQIIKKSNKIFRSNFINNKDIAFWISITPVLYPEKSGKKNNIKNSKTQQMREFY